MTEPEKTVLLSTASAIMRVGIAVLVFVVVGSAYLFYTREEDVGRCGVEAPPRPACGNVLDESAIAEMEARIGSKVNVQAGEKVFKGHCASCHKPDQDMTGPALKGILDRAPQPSVRWLHAFLSNEDSLIAVKDAYTINMLKNRKSEGAWRHPNELSQQDINNMIACVEVCR
ncbi:MAG: cytochrome c [Flavobacteriales bacterium]|nr:cytochrome c [Flavobacteriales bacterium]